MAEFQRTQSALDDAVESGHVSGGALTVGGIFLGMAALVGVFNFAAFRDGDMVWPTYTAIMGLIGVVCVAYGLMVRSRMSR
jgi:hypothetical protein